VYDEGFGGGVRFWTTALSLALGGMTLPLASTIWESCVLGSTDLQKLLKMLGEKTLNGISEIFPWFVLHDAGDAPPDPGVYSPILLRSDCWVSSQLAGSGPTPLASTTSIQSQPLLSPDVHLPAFPPHAEQKGVLLKSVGQFAAVSEQGQGFIRSVVHFPLFPWQTNLLQEG